MMSSKSKYKLKDVSSKGYSSMCRVRFEETLKRLPNGMGRPVLDIGEENALGKMLGVDDFTCWNLNYPWYEIGKYESITCFEVLEHLEDPVLFLMEVRKHLIGKFYLTTPVRWIGKGKYHFREYSESELKNLLIETGFVVESIERMRAYTWKWRYFGVRPIIRLIRDKMFGQCFFVVAK